MGFDFGGKPRIGGGIGFAGSPQVGKGAPDPLADVEYTGDLQADSEAELTAMQQAYRQRAKNEADRFQAATDSEHWFAVCFRSREEKEEFLEEFNLLRLGDKYLDGDLVGKSLRRDMEGR